MLRNEIQFTLKDGRQALIRSPRDEDIQGMLDYLYISSGETEFILRYPEECTKYTAEGEKALFDRMNNAANEAIETLLSNSPCRQKPFAEWLLSTYASNLKYRDILK